uniref:Uncharacterized protein n=1 Tax=Acrobeloides nanus TaxID=290746 RepID=A0A914D0R0_9BILA
MRTLLRKHLIRYLRWIHMKPIQSTSFFTTPCCSSMSTSAIICSEKLSENVPNEGSGTLNVPLHAQKLKVRTKRKKPIHGQHEAKELENELPLQSSNNALQKFPYPEIENLASLPKEKPLKIGHPMWDLLRPSLEDLDIVHRNDFDFANLIKDLPNSMSPEIVLAEGSQKYVNFQRISGTFFMFNVLLPLERKIEPYCTTIRNAEDIYLPTFMQWCGNALSDIEVNNRMKIVKRFIKVIRENGFKMSLPLLNNLMSVYIQNDHNFDPDSVLEMAEGEWLNVAMSVYIQNDHNFDPDSVLEMAEGELKLTVDKTFFNHYMWQIAKRRNLDRNLYDSIKFEMAQRGVFPDVQTMRAQIYGLAKRGNYEQVKTLIDQSTDRFGDDAKRKCIGAGLIGFSTSPHLLENLKVLLNYAVIKAQLLKPNMLNMEKLDVDGRFELDAIADDIFCVIWNLARISEDGFGKENVELIKKILFYTHAEQGYIGNLFHEIQRHLVHEYYYSALAMMDFLIGFSKHPQIQDTRWMRHLQKRFAFQFIKNKLPPTLVVELSNRLSINKLPPTLVVELSNRLSIVFGEKNRFSDDLARAILSYNGYEDNMKRFEAFATYIDVIDPERERPHLILPFLARLNNKWLLSKSSKEDSEEEKKDKFAARKQISDEKFRILYLFTTSLRYRNLADADVGLIYDYIVKDMIYEIRGGGIKHGYPIEDRNIIDNVTQKLISYGMTKADVWNFLDKLVKKSRSLGGKIRMFAAIENWLKNNENIESEFVRATFEDLKKSVLNRNFERTHEILVNDGIPTDSTMKEIIEPLINLYLDRANLGFLQKLLNVLSKINLKNVPKDPFDFDDPFDFPSTSSKSDDFGFESVLQNHHLLRILLKRFNETNDTSVQKLIDYSYELKRLFPHATNGNYYECVKAYRDLFKVLLKSPFHKNHTIEHVQKCAEFLQLLCKLQIIYLNLDETLTPFFVNTVLHRFGVDPAIDIWIEFQRNLYCSNALVPLLQYSLEKNNKDQIEFLLHKARRTMEPQKLDAYYAAILVNMKKFDEAEKFFSDSLNGPIKAQNCTAIFSIMLNFHYNNQPKLNFALEFLKLMLKYTDLKTDDIAKKKIHHSWIRTFGQNREVMSSLSIYELLRQSNMFPSANQIKELSDILKPHKENYEKTPTEKNPISKTASKSSNAT